jgi:hypothetical protein
MNNIKDLLKSFAVLAVSMIVICIIIYYGTL